MKYVKTIFIFLISLNISALCAEQSPSAEPLLVTETQVVTPAGEPTENKTTPAAVSTEKNELHDWNEHLSTLNAYWNATTNVPARSWVDTAIERAVKIIKENKELAEKLKSTFLEAINQHNTKITVDTIALITEFNSAIDKELGLPEPVVENKKESVTTTAAFTPTFASETVSIPEPQPETAATETVTTVTTEPSTTPVESVITEPTHVEPDKKDNLIEEWNSCLKDIKNKQGDIYELAYKAAELAQKLQESGQKTSNDLIKEFGYILDVCIAQKKLDQFGKSNTLSSFASKLGIYIPTPADQYQPEAPGLSPQAEIAEIQRKQREQEELAHLEAERQKEEMIKQAAINRATQQKLLTESQWQKAKISQMEAEQRAATEKLRELQNEARQLVLELKKSTAEQKTVTEKSLLTRAKEKVTELVWGPTQPKEAAEQAIAEKKKLLEQLNKQIVQEEEKLVGHARLKTNQAKKVEEINAQKSHEMTQREMERQAQLHNEQHEIVMIADKNNLEFQQNEWLNFMNYIRNMKHATIVDNNQITEQAIIKAESIIKLASRIPLINMVQLEQTLKGTFITALLDQQRGNQYHLYIFGNQQNFDNAINGIIATL